MQQTQSLQGEPLVCTYCGAPLREAPRDGYFICSYCDTRYPAIGTPVPSSATRQPAKAPVPPKFCNIPASFGPQAGFGMYTFLGVLNLFLAVIMVFVVSLIFPFNLLLGCFNVIVAISQFAGKKRAQKAVAVILGGERSVARLQQSLGIKSQTVMLQLLYNLIQGKQLVGFAVVNGTDLVPAHPKAL